MTRPAPSYSNPDARAVAILGLSLCAPGGETGGLDVEGFHEFLKRRGSGIITVPPHRWNAEAFHGNVPGKTCTTKGGFIPDFEFADIQEFGITPAEAGQAITLHLVALHQAFNALQRSGVDYRGTNTGVFVGCPGGFTPFDVDMTQVGAYFMTGASLSITANRINYVFDLLGPSTIVDTACSSTLTAMHLAIQAIRSGDCDQAVVAGVNLIASVADTVGFSQLGVLSPDGISKSFDNSADGYARADSAGAVVIKRHDLAVRDNDAILATLVGSALTSCGSIMGSLTTPNPEAQARAIHGAYKDAGLHPHQADFVELHGTGTVVGDSLEANLAGEVFSEGRNGEEILIGSVKSNVGHAEISAYMNSLTKVVLMLSSKELLPNGYFKTPSEKIEFEKYNLRVPVAVEEFLARDPEGGLIASISSFGFGGSCGHTVLREHEKRPARSTAGISAPNGPFLFTMGALTPKSCNTLMREYKVHYKDADFPTLCEHLGRRSRQMPYRTYTISDSLESATFPEPSIAPKRPNPIVFCFSGQGPQHWHQGRDLMAANPVFRKSILACDDAYKAYVGESFIDKTGLFMYGPLDPSRLETCLIWPAETISVSIAFFQISMFDMLTALGVQPVALVGHSLGETAVLYASGAASREMAVKIAVARGRALGKVDNIGGSMVAISGCDADTVRDYIDCALSLNGAEYDESRRLHLAAFNSPSDIGVSGPEDLLDVLANYISNWVDGVTARKLRVSTAVHSPFVDPCEETYRAELATIFSEHPGDHLPAILTVSTVIGEFVSENYNPNYLWQNLRQPVLFSTAIPKIIDRYGERTTFVEISPHPVLSQYIKDMGAHDSIGTGRRSPSPRQLKAGMRLKTEVHTVLDAIGRLLLLGVNSINFSMLNGYPSETLQDRIEYPFKKKFWPLANAVVQPASYQRWLLPATRALNSMRLRVGPYNPEPWMSHHVIDRSNLVPASAYLEMGLEFPEVTEVWDCQFEAVCILDESVPPTTLEISEEGTEWFVKSSTALQTMRGDLDWVRQSTPPFDTIHSRGKLAYGVPKVSPGGLTTIDVDAVTKRCFQTNTKEELYERLGAYAQFGPEFMRINKSCMNETEVVAWIRGHVDGLNATDYNFHPAILDAVFQLYKGLDDGSRERNVFLPRSVKRAFRNNGSLDPLVLPEEFRAYARLIEWTPRGWTANAYVLDDDGSVLFTVEGLHFTWVSRAEPLPSVRYATHWQPYALPPTTSCRSIILERPTPESDVAELLAALDKLAVSYASATVTSLPEDYTSEDPNRRHCFACCKELAVNTTPYAAKFPDIDDTLKARFEHVLAFTHEVGNRQKDLLISSHTATKLFSQDDVMDRLYESPPFTGPVFDQFVTHFVDLAKAAFTAGKRVIRVLEIGARQGHLTKLLGQALVDAAFEPGHYVDYFCSDTNIAFAQRATVKSPWTTMSPIVYDPAGSIEAHGLEPASFDIIVGFNALYGYSDIPKTLTNLRGLLVPGGYLAVVELDGSSFAASAIGSRWLKFVFDTMREELRGSTSALLSLPAWSAELNSAGYTTHLLLSAISNCIEHIAFISQASPWTHVTNGFSKYSDDDLTIIRHFPAGDETNLVAFLSTLEPTEPYSIWLHANTPLSNAALLGLSRTLCHEYPAWNFFTILFHPSWDVCRQEEFISLRLFPLKLRHMEMMVDESGILSVPRVVEAPAPPTTELRESGAIQFAEVGVWRHYPPELLPEDVEVAVSFVCLAPVFPGCSEFSGIITAVGSGLEPGGLVGKRVFGIAAGYNGSVVVCPQFKVSVTPDDLHPAVAAALVGRLAFISSVILRALPTNERRLVMLHAGGCSAAAITTYSYLLARGFPVLVTLTDISNLHNTQDFFHPGTVYAFNDYRSWSEAACTLAPMGVDLVISFEADLSMDVETVRILASNGTLIQIGGDLPRKLRRGQRYLSVDWSLLAEGDSLLSCLDDVQPAVRHALFSTVETFDLSQLPDAHEKVRSNAMNNIVLLGLEDIEPRLPVTRGGISAGTAAFNPRASYVLIGGVGGLGINLACGLVENGAKHIVLTSRSGSKTLENLEFVRERRIVDYLRGLPGVTVDITAVDCLDAEKTRELFSNISHPVAGVLFLPVKLHDQLFVNLKTEDDWKLMYDVKVKGLQVLLDAVDPASLDFLVLTSTTSALGGSAGQANYTAAQLQMETIGAGLPNTVSIAVPPLLDSGVLARSLRSSNNRQAALEKYKSLGFTTRHVVLQCIDAIFSLSNKPRNPVYIPALDWKMVLESGLAPPRTLAEIHHLIAKAVDEPTTSGSSYEGTIRATCAKVLSLNVDEVDETMPLSGYGLDSLTAARLKGMLKANFDLDVTQLQLLSSYMTVQKLLSIQTDQAAKTLEAESAIPNSDPDASSTGDGSVEDETGGTVIRLNDAKHGLPVFFVHGAGGGVLVLRKFAQKIQVPVYGLQDTPEAPLTGTIQRLAVFYLKEIKKRQWTGPYRLGGFSFGTAVALVIAQMLRAAGEKVEMLIMLDGAPTLFHRPQIRERTRQRITDGTMSDSIMSVVEDMVASGVIDGAEDVRAQFAEYFEQGHQGRKWVARFCQAYAAHLLMGVRESMRMERLQQAGALDDFAWPAERTLLMKAQDGMQTEPQSSGTSEAFDLDEWTDNVDLHEFPGTHFGFLNPASGLGEALNVLLG